MSNTIGKKIRRLRESRELSRVEVAAKLGLTYAALSKYETDKREPDYGTILNMAEFFDVSIDFLLGREENPYSIKSIKAIGYDDKLIDISALSPDMQQLVRKMAEDARQNKIKKS